MLEVKVETAVKVEPQKKRKLSYNEQREYDQIESTVLELEARIEEIESLFAQENFYNDYADKVESLSQELSGHRKKVEALYSRWEELEALIDND